MNQRLARGRADVVIAASADSRERAATLLRQGALVAFATETVYGLGADARNGAAIARLFAAKGRPRFNPLIVHVHDAAVARTIGDFDAMADALARAFWPGPLSLVVPLRADAGIAPLTTAGLDSIAIRVPAHRGAQALLAAANLPVAAPSANRSGRISPTAADHVWRSLGERAALILDDGPCPIGLESTIVGCFDDGPRLLRPGGLALEAIEEVAGPVRIDTDSRRPQSPGQFASHYAPRLPLRLGADSVAGDEGLLAFGPNPPVGAALSLNLSAGGDLTEAAANLFPMLWQLSDSDAIARIAVQPVPEHGLGRAINDRLRRAAAPRDGQPARSR